MINGNWFCCTDCTWVHNSLKKICTLGAKPVPTPFFDLLKKPHSTKNTPINLSWQIFRGGDTEDRVLLSQSLQFLKVRPSAILFTGKNIYVCAFQFIFLFYKHAIGDQNLALFCKKQDQVYYFYKHTICR